MLSGRIQFTTNQLRHDSTANQGEIMLQRVWLLLQFHDSYTILHLMILRG